MVYGLSAACLILFLLYIDARVSARKKHIKEVVRYVDTSGVLNNPPTFQETWHNKTINFKVSRYAIKISHLPIKENLEYIARIAGHFAVLKNGIDSAYNAPFSEKERASLYVAHHTKIVEIIYKLSKPFAKGWGYKKAFFAKGNSDAQFIWGIAEQIFDYWQNMGKLLGVLSKGLTPRLVYGEILGSDRLKWDAQGKRLITPRYAFTPKSKLKLLNGGKTKTTE